MEECTYCHSLLTHVADYEDSTFFICKKCHTLWDITDNGTEELAIDVASVLRNIREKEIAS